MRMPLYGENTAGAGIWSHEIVLGLRPTAGSGMQFFIEPVAVVVNWAVDEGFSEISMIGLSGGGWTTTLAAAIDPRIRYSFPVAGSLPLYVRTSDLGDAEQFDPATYSIAGYPDLYVLGGAGDGSRQRQILNRYDDCCFSGVRHLAYEEYVRSTGATIGSGEWDVFIDSSHVGHLTSLYALEEAVLPILEGR